MKSAVLERHTYPFYTPDVFYPQGWHTASGGHPGWYFVALSGLTYVLGTVATLNLVQLTTVVIGGFGVYLLVHHLTRNRIAAMIAGCAYISTPALTVRLGGNLHLLLGMQWLPYTILLSIVALERPRSAWRWAALGGLALALAILGSWYYLFVATLPLIVLLLVLGRDRPWRHHVTVVIVLVIMCIVVISPFAYLTFQARIEMFRGEASFDVMESDAYSLSPDRLLVPNPLHPLWGEASRAAFPIHGEQDVVSIGYGVLVLALLGATRLPAAQTRAFIAMAALSLLLAMGTTLHWNGQRVEVPVSQTVERLYHSLNLGVAPASGHTPVPLPGLLLYKVLPLYDSIRVWSRFDIALMLSIAVLAGLGSAHLLRNKGAATAGVLLLGLLILFEGMIAPYNDFTPVAVNARPRVTQWLSSLPEGTAIIEYPRPIVDKIAMYSQSLHGLRIVNGYMSHVPYVLKAADAQLGLWPTGDSVRLLRDWGVDYVIINGVSQDAFQATLAGLRTLDGVCLVRSFDEGFMFFTETHAFRVLNPGEVCAP
jgi:hypothetical protein